MDAFRIRTINLQKVQNQTLHKTEGLSSTTVVLRRGQAFTVTINYDGRAFDPLKEKMIFQIVLGPLSVDVPVSRLAQPSLTQWTAVLERSVPGPTAARTLSVSLSSPASASIGVYTLKLRVKPRLSVERTHSVGQITLLCNPWCQADSVFLESEDLRTEYVTSDIGVLFRGSSGNYSAKPWSLDQYEKGILDICMKLLQLSPQNRADLRKDLQNRSDPVYIGRVISAMVNSNDDKGVLIGRWSGNYSDGVNPSTWSGSGDILKKWAETQFRSVKYGQCWVFAAVMCTVMRALGIPTRIITNFNSAHDTDGNMVIEEYYDENGKKLSISFAGGAGAGAGGGSAVAREASKGVAVSLKLLKPPVLGENISFSITIVNNEAAPKQLKKHVNAQNKVYNSNPTETFWEAHEDIKIGPNETVTAKHEISFKEYMREETADDALVNLAVVIEDVNSQERVLAAEEFNIRSPTLTVQVQNESSVVINAPQVATVSFMNPFDTAVSGELIISGSGLLEEKVKMRVTIQPKETMRKPVNFTPKMAGSKMLSASLVLTNPPTVLHGFTTINVKGS
ncbi:protein-glutamine gamma-glutamyltransferase 5-like [Garra rufa]|uniref:protein-glutamine gamma-glutamyltransferase 5-like n=1 Tax=Garra rufa TaxID=137080 RepID=UPI003CCEB7FC